MSERNPKDDPRRGDILKVPGERREVLGRITRYVEYICKIENTSMVTERHVCAWRRWARNAEIIERGE